MGSTLSTGENLYLSESLFLMLYFVAMLVLQLDTSSFHKGKPCFYLFFMYTARKRHCKWKCQRRQHKLFLSCRPL